MKKVSAKHIAHDGERMPLELLQWNKNSGKECREQQFRQKARDKDMWENCWTPLVTVKQNR